MTLTLTSPNAELFTARREALMTRMGGGVALIPAAHETIRNRDVVHPYRESSDFYYLTGIEEPGALLLLSPDSDEARAVLWVRPRDRELERWTGARLGPEGAVKRSGVDEALPLDSVSSELPRRLATATRLYHAFGESPELDRRVIDLLKAFRQQSRSPSRGLSEVHDLSDLLHEQRMVKDVVEVAALRRAVKLTADGIRAAMAHTAPGRHEFELRAALEATFLAGGAARCSFETIVASGPNAAVLHYVGGKRKIGRDDLVLIDAGAEVDYLSGDLSRTFPASGRFTSAQRDLYDAVAQAQAAAIAACGPGLRYDDIHQTAVRSLTASMVALGLLSGAVDPLVEDESYKRYFPHRLGHYVGMDVHDVGRYRDEGGWRALSPGEVVTVEPGLYVPADDTSAPPELRGVGVRIEDVVLITPDGAENLSVDLPREAEAVAALVGEERF